MVNILRPDMVGKDKPYITQSRPHIVVELYPDGTFLGIPFSTSCDTYGERPSSEVFPRGVGGRTQDGWLCTNRTKSFTVNDLERTERLTYLKWKQGHIDVHSPWMGLIFKLTRRWVNFKRVFPNGIRFHRPYPDVIESSFTKYDD
jgi:hypothetical protein